MTQKHNKVFKYVVAIFSSSVMAIVAIISFIEGFGTHYGIILSLIAILTAIALSFLSYLKGNGDSKQNDEDYYISRKNLYLSELLEKKIEAINEYINKSDDDKVIKLTEEDKEKIFGIITETISSNINNEFLKSLDEKYSLKIMGETKYNELLISFDQTRKRILAEIYNLTRRANLNLIVGIITTIIAGVVLIYSVYNANTYISDVTKTLSYFIPKISTVIFIEVFSFFFLKLYRSNLNDIKYYQNEMTNIEFKIYSLKSALMIDDKETLTQIILELSKTERNCILQKGETTVEIETAKNQNNFDNFNNLKVILDNIAKFKDKE